MPRDAAILNADWSMAHNVLPSVKAYKEAQCVILDKNGMLLNSF